MLSPYFYGTMRILSLIILLIFSLPYSGYSQEKVNTITSQGLYTDRITDEYGKALAGIKIQIEGKGVSTYSDFNGNFSIKAKKGDVVILSKDGQQINSYRLTGMSDYQVEDKNDVFTKKISSVSRTSKYSNYYLDSAIYYYKKDPYKSIDFIEQQLRSKKRQNSKDLIKSYTLLGDNYMYLKQYDLAISNYQTSLKNTADLAITIKLAKALTKEKRYTESNKHYTKILSKKLSGWQKVEVNEGLGTNANKQNQIDTALLFYQKALLIAEKHQITPKISSLNVMIASILAKKGEKTKANIYIQNTLETSRSEHLQKRAKVQNKVADVYQVNKDFDNEIQLRKQTLDELEEAQVESILLESDENKPETKISASQLNLDIGRAYIDKLEYDKAIPYLEKSAAKALINKNLEIQKNAVQKLSELYKKIGNSKKALQSYQEYARIVDDLYQEKESEIQAAVNMSSILRDKQNRINSLEKDRELTKSRYQLTQSEQELTLANYRRQRLLIYGLVFGLVLFSIALFSMYRSNKQKRLANNLLALKSLRSQMNPHFIFNALNSVNSFIAQNDERSANRYLTDFSTLMRNVLNNSEEDFIPLSKEIELLQLYLQLEHSRFEDKFNYEIQIDEKLQIDEFQIPPMLLQPYVENAVWHGLRYKKTKGKLLIDFKQKNTETILISITDDGIGRKKSKELKTQNQKKQQSKGMKNIKKRINILNEMYADKVDVFIDDLYDNETGTKVILTLKKD